MSTTRNRRNLVWSVPVSVSVFVSTAVVISSLSLCAGFTLFSPPHSRVRLLPTNGQVRSQHHPPPLTLPLALPLVCNDRDEYEYGSFEFLPSSPPSSSSSSLPSSSSSSSESQSDQLPMMTTHNNNLRSHQPPPPRSRTSTRATGRPNRLRLQLSRPVRILDNDNSHYHHHNQYEYHTPSNHHHYPPTTTTTTTTTQRIRTPTRLQISTGLTFWDEDGDQLLVSAQKPLGIVLEEMDTEMDSDSNSNSDNVVSSNSNGVRVMDVSETGSAYRSGVRVGDRLVAVQNVNVENTSFEEIMDRIATAPRVVNLRFWRKSSTQ